MIKIEDVKGATFVNSLLGLFFIICPGTAFIFLYDKSIFMDLDWMKLLFLSVAVSLPMILTSLAWVLVVNEESLLDSPDGHFKALLQALIMSTGFIFGAIALHELGRGMPLRSAYLTSWIINFSFFIIASAIKHSKSK